MRTFLHRLLGLARARGFDAAGGGRRWEGARTVDGLNAAILAGAALVMAAVMAALVRMIGLGADASWLALAIYIGAVGGLGLVVYAGVLLVAGFEDAKLVAERVQTRLRRR